MDMELEKRYRIAEWIAEQIAGILSEEEQALLEDWRQASPEAYHSTFEKRFTKSPNVRW
mgnify:CR=1 FL=1